ncbi:hypothetical protein OIU76_015749 [Salix suchowensis]|nr:hypothetical protein OIU76_015749 [Salix suchowensis]
MSKEGNSPMLDLKLNLSPPRAYQQVESLSNSSWDMSADCSCVSSEPEDMAANYPGSPDRTPMLLVGLSSMPHVYHVIRGGSQMPEMQEHSLA